MYGFCDEAPRAGGPSIPLKAALFAFEYTGRPAMNVEVCPGAAEAEVVSEDPRDPNDDDANDDCEKVPRL